MNSFSISILLVSSPISSVLHSAVDKTCRPKKFAAVMFIPAVFATGTVRLEANCPIMSSSFWTVNSSMTDERRGCLHSFLLSCWWRFNRAVDWHRWDSVTRSSWIPPANFILVNCWCKSSDDFKTSNSFGDHHFRFWILVVLDNGQTVGCWT